MTLPAPHFPAPHFPAPRILALGDQALSVEFGDHVAPEIHDRVLALDAALAETAIPGVTETVPSYRALMVLYDVGRIRGAALAERLAELARHTPEAPPAPRHWRVPVLYGGEAGLDFEDLQARTGLSAEDLIAAHAGAEYRVYMIGFAPGFTYLGGLAPVLHSPRLSVPRQITPAGGIALGGVQACISARPVPSGWRFLGRTPLRAFDPARAEPFVFRPGDRIRFHPVTEAEAVRLDALSEKGEICAEEVAPA